MKVEDEAPAKMLDGPVEGSRLQAKQSVEVDRGLNCYTILVLFIGILGGLLFGLDIGTAAITSMNPFRAEMGIPVLQSGQTDSPETTSKIAMFAVLFHVFSLIGAPFAGQFADKFGRKPIILIASTFFGLGAIWQTLAGLISPSFGWTSIILGRCVGGIGNGFILTIMPVYAAELSPSKYRGKVITMFQFNITVGIFLMALINNAIKDTTWGWRVGFMIQCIPCVNIILCTLFFLPESPRYLMRKNRETEAREALIKLCLGSSDSELIAEKELNEIAEELAELTKVGESSFLECFQGSALPAVICGVMVAFSQNVTGVNWFMNYATQLFSSLGFQPFLWDLILKLLNMVATLAALVFVERFGRKFLTVWGVIFVVIVFSLIGFVIIGSGVDIQTDHPTSKDKSIQSFCLAMIFAFQVVFAITWGPLGWLVPSEVFSIRIRGKGMSMAVVANMLTNIILGDYGYNLLNSATSTQATSLILVLLNIVIVCTTVVFLQPETKGVSLEDMRKVFGYEYGGDPTQNHGTLMDFFKRNGKQTLDILRCRGANPRIGFERFDEPLKNTL
eukprot:CAMPEP_0203746936 /NCGR_PEP_ID=MMETSP0098-20131031/2215_1 /ASSEMBLY_ACC=CAM_ASM_000208 /TAXON_ID=96639 /ORGANISM=" , Strain NY0313808BC1" /LENGTH=561 /DNA_ID=CAMNT_0050635191 /DNA_START=96 /DNA_END=1781 /DNA_ORIENTATION=+